MAFKKYFILYIKYNLFMLTLAVITGVILGFTVKPEELTQFLECMNVDVKAIEGKIGHELPRSGTPEN